MHLSGIESGKIVPRCDTLLDLVGVLDHDLLMVPRALVAAVRALMRDRLNQRGTTRVQNGLSSCSTAVPAASAFPWKISHRFPRSFPRTSVSSQLCQYCVRAVGRNRTRGNLRVCAPARLFRIDWQRRHARQETGHGSTLTGAGRFYPRPMILWRRLPIIPGDKLALNFGGSRSGITVDQMRRFADRAIARASACGACAFSPYARAPSRGT